MSGRAVRETVLTIGAIGGGICLLVALSGWLFGTSVLVVESGSMEPTIQTGALIVTRDVPASALHRGDIVTVQTGSGQRVTHRIHTITHRGENATFVLKGDANKVPDPDVHTAAVAGRLMLNIPGLGRVVAVLSSPLGLLLVGGYLFFLGRVVFEEWRGRGNSQRPPRAERRRSGSRRLTGAAGGAACALLVAASVIGSAPRPTYAAWTDSVPVAGSTVGTTTIPAPTLSCGAFAALSSTLQLTWSAVAGATNYTLYYNNGANSVTVNGTLTSIPVVLNVSTQAWVVANRDYGSTTWSSQPSNHRNYTFLLVASVCT